MKPISYKRVLAYLIDILIVTIIGSLLTMFIPVSSEYKDASNELTIIMESYQDNKISKEEYLEKVNDISYVVSKEGVETLIITVALTTIYFVVFAYYMNGQTVGKKIMKIQIVSSENKKLKMNNYLIRSLFIDSILMNIISIITILLMNKTLYLKTYDILTTIFASLEIVIFAMILFREDGRGLHDIIAKTKVVSIENTKNISKEIEVVKDEIEEENNSKKKVVNKKTKTTKKEQKK